MDMLQRWPLTPGSAFWGEQIKANQLPRIDRSQRVYPAQGEGSTRGKLPRATACLTFSWEVELSSPPDKLLPLAWRDFCACVSKLLPSNDLSGIFWIFEKITFNSCTAKLQDTRLDVNSYQSRAQPNCSVEDVAPVGLSPAECLRLHTFVLPWALFWKLCFLLCAEDSLHDRIARVRLCTYIIITGTYIVKALRVPLSAYTWLFSERQMFKF